MNTPQELKKTQNDAWVLHIAARLPKNISETAKELVKLYRRTLSTEFSKDLFDNLIGDKADIQVDSEVVERAKALREMVKRDRGRNSPPMQRLFRPKR